MAFSNRHCERSAAIHLSSAWKDRLPRRLRLLAMTGMALLLNGCLVVEDFGHAWKDSKPDACLSKIAESLYAAEYRRDPTGMKIDTLAHGWTLDGNTYLLLKKAPEDKGGRLYRFQVTNGIFQRFRLDPAMRDLFEKDYPNAPVSLKRDTVRLKTLDAEREKLLTSIANKPEYWQIEEQTLYNTLGNPACRFDDRDLKKLDK